MVLRLPKRFAVSIGDRCAYSHYAPSFDANGRGAWRELGLNIARACIKSTGARRRFVDIGTSVGARRLKWRSRGQAAPAPEARQPCSFELLDDREDRFHIDIAQFKATRHARYGGDRTLEGVAGRRVELSGGASAMELYSMAALGGDRARRPAAPQLEPAAIERRRLMRPFWDVFCDARPLLEQDWIRLTCAGMATAATAADEEALSAVAAGDSRTATMALASDRLNVAAAGAAAGAIEPADAADGENAGIVCVSEVAAVTGLATAGRAEPDVPIASDAALARDNVRAAVLPRPDRARGASCGTARRAGRAARIRYAHPALWRTGRLGQGQSVRRSGATNAGRRPAHPISRQSGGGALRARPPPTSATSTAKATCL